MYVCISTTSCLNISQASALVLFCLSSQSADSAPKLIPCSNLFENTVNLSIRSFPSETHSLLHPGSAKGEKERKKKVCCWVWGRGGSMTQKNNTKGFPAGFFHPFFPNCFWGSGRSPAFPIIFFFSFFFFFILI